MERPTRLELATSTLARWRSTRWATAAHVSIASSDVCYYNRPFPKSQGFSCILFHIFSNLFSFPISNSRAFPVTFFSLVLLPGPRNGFLHLHRYSYYVASHALFLHPRKQINHCFLYSLFRFFLLFKKQLDKRLCFDYQNKLSYKAAQQPALIFTPVFDTAELGRTDMQSSFLLHLTNHGIRKGFSRLYWCPASPVFSGRSRQLGCHHRSCTYL